MCNSVNTVRGGLKGYAQIAGSITKLPASRVVSYDIARWVLCNCLNLLKEGGDIQSVGRSHSVQSLAIDDLAQLR